MAVHKFSRLEKLIFFFNLIAVGATIAPPPSLDDSPVDVPIPQPPKSSYGGVGGSVAAKIMAKYGFKVKCLEVFNILALIFL